MARRSTAGERFVRGRGGEQREENSKNAASFFPDLHSSSILNQQPACPAGEAVRWLGGCPRNNATQFIYLHKVVRIVYV